MTCCHRMLLIVFLSAVSTEIAVASTPPPPATVKLYEPSTHIPDPSGLFTSVSPTVVASAAAVQEGSGASSVVVALYSVASPHVTSYAVAYDVGSPAGSSSVIANATGSVITELLPFNGQSGSVIVVGTTSASTPSSASYIARAAAEGSTNGGAPWLSWNTSRGNTSSTTAAWDATSGLVVAVSSSASNAAIATLGINGTTGVTMWSFRWPAGTDDVHPGVLYRNTPSSPLRSYTMVNGSLYELDAASGLVLRIASNPCGVSLDARRQGQTWRVAIVPFTDTEDAVIIYTTVTNPELAGTASPSPVCRFSHTAWRLKWMTSMLSSVVVDDVTGGGGNIFVSTHSTSMIFSTSVFNATTGFPAPFPYVRLRQDAASFPRRIRIGGSSSAALPGCAGGIMAQQVSGQLVAYCAEYPGASIWTLSSVGCHFSPLPIVSPVPSQPELSSFLCYDQVQHALTMVQAMSGITIWTLPSVIVTQAPVTDGVLSAFATVSLPGGVGLLQLSLRPSIVGGAAPDNGGLSGGEQALIAIIATVAAAAVVFAVYRARRPRGARRAQSLISDDAVGVNGRDIDERAGYYDESESPKVSDGRVGAPSATSGYGALA